MVLCVPEDDSRVPLAALLRWARNSLGRVIRSALDDAGFDDLPANGPYVISAASGAGVSLAAIIDQLGLSKQASGHLVDLLVVRGYLDRHVDPADRRRFIVSPTERGTAAAAVIRRAADGLEARLVASVGAGDVEAARHALASLAALGVDDA
jgi:DNA-binding MarR family transcriptional regulator